MKMLSMFAIITLFFLGCNYAEDLTSSSSQKQVTKTLKVATANCKEKYKINSFGQGASMPGGIAEKLFLAFYHIGHLSKEEIRRIMVGCTQEIYNAAHSNPELQIHLKEKSFKIEDVEINLFIQDIDGNNLYDPDIGVADIRRGIITYQTRDSQTKYGYKTEITETYIEALKLLEKRNDPI